MRTTAMKQRAGLSLSETSVRMDTKRIEQYLNALKAGGRKAQTVRSYRRSLTELYDFLQEGKEITKESLEEWRKYLKKNGYSDSTINQRLTAVNGLLRYCGVEELAASHERLSFEDESTELTRTEYLQFLSSVRDLGAEREFFLIKVLGSIDIGIGELKCLTLESCKDGNVRMPDGRQSDIPACLKKELMQYAKRHNIKSGPIFVTRTGNNLDRSNLSNSIHRMADMVGADVRKCSPSALHRLYQTTQQDLKDRMQPLYKQSYENLLNTEQAMVAWE